MKQLVRLTIGFLALSLSVSAFAPSAKADAANLRRAAITSGSTLAVAATVSYKTGGGLRKICTTLTGQWACPMAALAFVQALSQGNEAIDSYKTRDDAECVGAYCGYDSGLGGGDGPPDWKYPDPKLDPYGNPMGGLGLNDPEFKATMNKLSSITRGAKDNLANLADKGYTYDPKTGMVNTPMGPISASSLGDASGMAALGMTKDQIEQAQAVIKAASGAGGIGDGSYGGGGGGRRVASVGEAGLDMKAYMAALNGGAGKRKPASLDGMKKYLGNEPIGLAVDNIFEMVHRQYGAQSTRGAFLP